MFLSVLRRARMRADRYQLAAAHSIPGPSSHSLELPIVWIDVRSAVPLISPTYSTLVRSDC